MCVRELRLRSRPKGHRANHHTGTTRARLYGELFFLGPVQQLLVPLPPCQKVCCVALRWVRSGGEEWREKSGLEGKAQGGWPLSRAARAAFPIGGGAADGQVTARRWWKKEAKAGTCATQATAIQRLPPPAPSSAHSLPAFLLPLFPLCFFLCTIHLRPSATRFSTALLVCPVLSPLRATVLCSQSPLPPGRYSSKPLHHTSLHVR